ncbi:MAG: hypothetical protein K9N52_07805 [Verrucomicrobia bacterium]|nr:hypothetical protein [Verrucomicrobiota bacterium]
MKLQVFSGEMVESELGWFWGSGKVFDGWFALIVLSTTLVLVYTWLKRHGIHARIEDGRTLE